MSKIRFVGLDVHADTIAVAVAEADGEVRSLGIIPNRLESSWHAAIGPATSRRFGSPTQITKPCGIWSERTRMPGRISIAPVTA